MAKWYSEDPEYTQISEKDYCHRRAIEKILEHYETEMENYGYYGSNRGVPKDDYEDVAEEIMTIFSLWEIKDV